MDVYRACLTCGEPTPGPRCPPCQTEVSRRVNRRRAEAGTLGASWAWRRKSRAVRRAQPACAVCGTDRDLTVDHLTPRAVGGTDDHDNLVTMCRRHNAAKGTRRA